MTSGRIVLGSLLILSLCACNGNVHDQISENSFSLTDSILSDEENEDLKNTVNDAMKALKNLDMDHFNTYTNNKQIMVTPWGDENTEYTMFGELCEEQQTNSDKNLVYQLDKEIVKNLSWEILEIAQNENTAKLTLQITNLNMEGIFQKSETDSEMIEEIRKIPPNSTKTVALKLKAEKQNEKWILLIDVDFANAVSSNIWIVDTSDYISEIPPYDVIEYDSFSSDSTGDSIIKEIQSSSYTYEGVANASKKQRIEIISSDDNRITTQITDLHEITDFLNQEEQYNWTIVESIPDDSEPILSVIRYALARKTRHPQLVEQSHDLLYQAGDIYYIQDKTTYSYSSVANNSLPHYYEIPNHVGEYLKQFLQ